MKHSDRDLSTLRHIVFYCDEIDGAIDQHGLTLEKVKADSLYKNALAMNILQIGELVNVLSEEFKSLNSGSIPWRDIKRMRDKAAHHYGSFDTDTLWETVTNDIAQLRNYCIQYIEELNKQLPESDSTENQ
ncbi:MAG: DUF86 domain-containing protein [Coriobacteriales bacterium]|jgi:uncharacterized protein with HEPN domain|nr:DUF86 domain-containing protein [Coriobacteriales bacterium]